MVYPYVTTSLLNSSVDKILSSQSNKIKQLQAFFECDNEQVVLILQIISIYKSSFPIGMTIIDLVDFISIQNKFELFGSKSYIFSTVNRMAVTGLIELRQNNSFDITSLGQDYVMEQFKR